MCHAFVMLALSAFVFLSFLAVGEAANSYRNDLRADVNDSLPIVYHLFTRSNPVEYQVLRLNDLDSLQLSYYDPTLLTKLYAPGWNNDGSIAYPTRDAYLQRENVNVIVVYWPDIQEGNGNSLFVKRTTQIAADHCGAFINFLIENGASISSFHLIGHSAGTHLAGGAGAAVALKQSQKIPRVTGLDPADATWDFNEPDTSLDMSDAIFVDIMHTNGGNMSNGGIAFIEPFGHADFYVNGGRIQPGCTTPDNSCCSHCRATDLFAESINSPLGFISLQCDTYDDFLSGACSGNAKVPMGDPTPPTTSGVFYVDTNEQAPWAMGDVN